MDETGITMPVKEGKRQGKETCPRSHHEKAAKLPQETGSNVEVPRNFDRPQETGSYAESPNPYTPQPTGLDADEPCSSETNEKKMVIMDKEALKEEISSDIHPDIGLDARTSPQESVQIDVEELKASESNESKCSGKEKIPLRECVRLHKAALKGDWQAATSMLQRYPDAIRAPLTMCNETALHIAIAGKHTIFVEQVMKLITSKDLELRTAQGKTTFAYAAISGNVDFAKKMMKMNDTLPFIYDDYNYLPIHHAVLNCRRKTVSYLISVTGFESLTSSDRINLLTMTITKDMYDIALEILRSDSTLATAKDKFGKTALQCLAEKSGAIGNTSELSCWKRYINFWFKGPCNKALMQTLARRLVEDLWRLMQELPDEQFLKQLDEQVPTVQAAVKSGNIEFLNIILHYYPDLIWKEDENKQNLFHITILNRQENIFNLIYDLGGFKDFIGIILDAKDNNLLHWAGELAPQDRLNTISGAALQMQREILWFKEIEKIVPPGYEKHVNLEGKTPQDIFTETHRELRKDSEKWMKDTANNCMIVATLIATVVFSGNFNIPGGNNQENDTPIFLRSNWFFIFFVSNATAFLSSSTSILIFLSILTCRYTEDDFLNSLPRRLVFGLTTLFFSIVGMVLAFSATCVLGYQSKTAWIPFIIIALAGFPIILFILLHYKLWFDTMRSIYWTRFPFQQCRQKLL